jgi:Holliday junction DNA helicase RuvB
MMAVDDLGLTQADRRFLKALAEKHRGGPVGLETMAATISEDTDTIESVYEPYLLQIGFLRRTPRGRILTEKAFQFLKIKVPEQLEQKQLL